MANSLKISAVSMAVIGALTAASAAVAASQVITGENNNDIKLTNATDSVAGVSQGVVVINGISVENNSNSSSDTGAGLHVLNGTTTINGKGQFSGNHALKNYASGGAIYVDGTRDDGATLNLTGNNDFINNSASYSGGAIYNGYQQGQNSVEKRAKTNISGTNSFQKNSAARGGAIANGGVMSISGAASFTGNSSSEYGGAIYNISELTLEGDVNFDGNSTEDRGGAIYNGTGGKLKFDGGSYVFTGNTAAGKSNDIDNYGAEVSVSGGALVELNGGIISRDYVNSADPKKNVESLVSVSGTDSQLILNGASQIERLKMSDEGALFVGADSKVGTLTADSGTFVTIDNGAKLTLTGASNAGTIILGDVDSFGTLEVASNLNVEDLQAYGASQLYIANDKSEVVIKTVSGEGKLSVKGTSQLNDARNGDLTALADQIKIESGAAGTVIGYDEGTVVGAVTGSLNEKGELVGVKEEVNKNNASVLNKLDKSQRVLVSVVNNDLRKRLGDVRSGGSGVWARISGAEISGDNSFESDVKLVQLGADTTIEGTNVRVGGAFSYGKADSDDKFGSADFDAYSVAGYGVWMNDAGQFVDVVARYTKFDTDLIDRGQNASLSNDALSLSSELGWRLNLSKSVFVEPSVELAYTHIDGDSYALGATKYDYASVNSLQGRAGFMAGLKCPNDFGNVYVRAALVHEFDGDAEMKASAAGTSRLVKNEGKDTWFEYAVGANFNVAKTSQVYVDLERTSGSVIDEDWRANVGVRYNF